MAILVAAGVGYIIGRIAAEPMRAVELAKVAAAAEALRLRRLARRQAIRAGLGAGAAIFGIAVFVLLHVLAYDLLLAVVRPGSRR